MRFKNHKDDSITNYFNSTKVPYKVEDMTVISSSNNGTVNCCSSIDYVVYQSGEVVDYIYKDR